jgi:hypothetical protein
MNPQIHSVVNVGLCWFIVLMALGGYFLTLKRTGQKWIFWIILIAGWAFLAISNSFVALGISQGAPYLQAIWLISYVLVITSLVLLFIKLIQVKNAKSNGTTKEVLTGKDNDN